MHSPSSQPPEKNRVAASADKLASANQIEQARNSYYSQVRPEILNLVPISASRVLDVGCGAGILGASIKLRQPAQIHGVELTSDAAKKAAACLDHVWNDPIETVLPKLADGYYDCIVAADVLEHVIDPWSTLQALKEKLSPDGKMVVSLPNVQNWEVVANLLEGKWDYQSEGILDRTHLHFFTRKSIEELCWNAGMRIAHIGTTISSPPMPQQFLKSLNKCGLNSYSLELDSETYQFLLVIEKPKPTPASLVVVVILNWNGKEDTLECLASVSQLTYEKYEVLVVDNGSTDDSVQAISQKYPHVTLIKTGANLGYAGGNNVGIRHAIQLGASYVLILNNDTIVSPDMVDEFVKTSAFLPAGAVLGAKIYKYDEPETIWFAGGNWNGTLNRTEHIGDGQIDGGDFSRITQVGYVTGCALFASVDTFREVGLLDELFFLTFEETDWCYRARSSGRKCILVPSAKLWHRISSSFGGANSPLVDYFITRNKRRWAAKHLSHYERISLHKEALYLLKKILLPSFSMANTGVPLTKNLLWSISSWLKAVKRNMDNPTNRAVLFGLRDYYFRRFGDCPDTIRHLAKKARQLQ